MKIVLLYGKEYLILKNLWIICLFRRAIGTNLYLNEISVERDLVGASLCINFSQSTIIPGTKLFFHKNALILFVPTQSGIHQFYIVLGDYVTQLKVIL